MFIPTTLVLRDPIQSVMLNPKSIQISNYSHTLKHVSNADVHSVLVYHLYKETYICIQGMCFLNSSLDRPYLVQLPSMRPMYLLGLVQCMPLIQWTNPRQSKQNKSIVQWMVKVQYHLYGTHSSIIVLMHQEVEYGLREVYGFLTCNTSFLSPFFFTKRTHNTVCHFSKSNFHCMDELSRKK